MNSLCTVPGTLAQWPTGERVRALKRIIPRAKVQTILRRTGHARRQPARGVSRQRFATQALRYETHKFCRPSIPAEQ
jgi:hypothetical protein